MQLPHVKVSGFRFIQDNKEFLESETESAAERKAADLFLDVTCIESLTAGQRSG